METDKMTFGKYKGETYSSIIEKDTQYITWALNNVAFFYLNENDKELYDDKLKEDLEKQSNRISSYVPAFLHEFSRCCNAEGYELSELKDNWDGYGASAPSIIVLYNLTKFIYYLENNGLIIKYDVDITPTSYGTIDVDINSNNGLVSIEIGTRNIGYFTDFVDKHNYTNSGIETNFIIIPEELNLILNKL